MDIRRNEQGKVEVLIQWKGLPAFENTCESADRRVKSLQDSPLRTRRYLKEGINSYEETKKH